MIAARSAVTPRWRMTHRRSSQGSGTGPPNRAAASVSDQGAAGCESVDETGQTLGSERAYAFIDRVDDFHHVEGLDLLLELFGLDAVAEHRHTERAGDRDDLRVRLERLLGAEQIHPFIRVFL